MYRGRALVIAPHADDETFGCGGTIAKMKATGVETSLVIVAHQPPLHHLGDTVRSGELAKAAKVLGINDYMLIKRYTDTILDTVPQVEIISKLEEKIRACVPDYVFIPFPSHHQDHKAVYDASIAALRPGSLSHYPRMILAYEYPYPDWNVTEEGGHFYVNITEYFSTKIRALKCYESQLKIWPHPVSIGAAKRLAAFRGMTIGVHYAERFKIIRMIG